MNFNISPIAFYTSRNAQPWRNSYAQKKISIVVGEDLPAFIINNAPDSAPTTVELYEPNTDTLVTTLTTDEILLHVSTQEGTSVVSWIYQASIPGEGIFGFHTPGYYYLKVGNYYSDIIKFGAVVGDYVQLTYQFFDDIITADGTLISSYVPYKQIFETDLWHPTYEVQEEGKENNGIFYAMQQTTKKQCGFSTIVNEAQLDTLNLTRMADSVRIEARTNGVVKTFVTNQFEIKSKWESDDVASIEVAFDLFNIIRKYQKSSEAPEPLPLPVPPTPPSIYTITGSASGVASIGVTINGAARTIAVSGGTFEIGYDTAITTLVFDTNKTSITALNFSQSCGLRYATQCSFEGMSNLTTVNFSGCTFERLTSAARMFKDCKIDTLDLPDATFDVCTNTDSMFENVSSYVRRIEAPKAIFGAVTSAKRMFYDAIYSSGANQSITFSLATFASVTDATQMFAHMDTDCLSRYSFPIATFASVISIDKMFADGRGNSELNTGTIFPLWTAATVTSAQGMFENSDLKQIDITSIDFTNLINASRMFYSCDQATKLWVDTSVMDSVYNASYMFYQCKASAVTDAMETATFGAAVNVSYMFGKLSETTLVVPDATFASATNVEGFISGGTITSASLPEATFAAMTNADKLIYSCNRLVTLSMPKVTFAALPAQSLDADYYTPFNVCNTLANLTIASGNNFGSNVTTGKKFALDLRLPALTKNSFIGIENNCKALNPLSQQFGMLKVLQTWWDGLSAADQTAINNAKKTGWTIEFV